MSSHPVRALLFDLEGVIVDSEPLWSKADAEFLRRRGVEYNEEETKHHLMGTSMVDGARALMRIYGFTGDPEEMGKERRAIAKELFKNELSFMPGFLDFFKQTASNYPRAIATSLEREFFAVVDTRLHLSDMFDGQVHSIEDIGFISKPSPDIFLHAAKALGFDPAECLVIEDAPNGVAAARAAGMRCVAITNSTTRERLKDADQIVGKYTEIKI